MAVDEAQNRILKSIEPLRKEQVQIDDAYNRILATDIYSPFNLPLSPNSSMDGFAVRVEDLLDIEKEGSVTLTVVGDIPAGIIPQVELGPGQCARIMTGAVLPGGADAVVPVENTDFVSRDPGIQVPEIVEIYQPAKPGEYVREAGEDLSKGDLVISEGTRLFPEHIGILAMMGFLSVSVYSSPRVAIISTGDELIFPGEQLLPGKLYDSNSYTLAALVKQAGGITVSTAIAGDSLGSIENNLEDAFLKGVDAIISSAGVSVGAFDFIRGVIERNGQVEFWRVNMRPGKPFLFGFYKGIPFFGLPGNPVSAFVGFDVFVQPAILRMGGAKNWKKLVIGVDLLEPIYSDGRESYLRSKVYRKGGRYQAELTDHQGSGNLYSLIMANALLIVPAGTKYVPAGEQLEAWIIRDIIE